MLVSYGGTAFGRALAFLVLASFAVLTAFADDLTAPVMTAEPAATPGTINTVSWGTVATAAQYEAQCSAASGFGSPTSSGWGTGTSATFYGLTAGARYWYRVHACRTVTGSTSTWSQTSQADFDSDTKSNVTTLSSGDATLSLPANPITNPSFETYTSGEYLLPWKFTPLTAFSCFTATAASGNMPSGGTGRYVEMLTPAVSQSSGTSLELWQNVNLDGISTITFDAKLSGADRRCEFVVGTTVLWSRTSPGEYTGQTVDVSSYPGARKIILRFTVTKTTTGAGQFVMWDNFRPGYASSGTITSTAITPASLGKWGALSFHSTAPTGTTLSLDVLDAPGNLLKSNVSSGADLNALGVAAPSIRLRANLATTNGTITPTLADWSVSYQAADTTIVSDWSNIVSSTQTSPTCLLTYTGDTTNTYGNPITVKAKLTAGTSPGGTPISGTAINFIVGGHLGQMVTDANGDGTAALAANLLRPGTYPVVCYARAAQGYPAAAVTAMLIVDSAALVDTIVSGNGFFFSNGKRCQIQFGYDKNKGTGTLTYSDANSPKKTIVAGDGTVTLSADKHTATITGNCTVNGTATTFTLTVTDSTSTISLTTASPSSYSIGPTALSTGVVSITQR